MLLVRLSVLSMALLTQVEIHFGGLADQEVRRTTIVSPLGREAEQVPHSGKSKMWMGGYKRMEELLIRLKESDHWK